MNPGHTIKWEVHNHGDTRLYMPPGNARANDTVARLLLSGAVGEPLGSGNGGGYVFTAPKGADQCMAIKEFTPRTADRLLPQVGNRPYIQAHVTLGAGLDKLEEQGEQKGPWRIRTPQILGALVNHPDNAETDGWYARWVMERIMPLDTSTPKATTADAFMPRLFCLEESTHSTRPTVRFSGKADQEPALPSTSQREQLYDKALTAAGRRDTDVLMIGYDDGNSGNLLVQTLPKPLGVDGAAVTTPGIVAKIDVVPGLWNF
jgi:hypothetical protein